MKKLLITATLAVALLGTSVVSYANSNTNTAKSSDSQVLATVKDSSSDIANDPTNSKGQIEYTKIATLREDGSEGVVFETWTDPKTFNSRADNIIKGNPEFESNISTYTKDGGRKIITIRRDADGNPTEGELIPVNQAGADYNNSLFTRYNSFQALRAQYASSEWTPEETETTEDGKTLKKVSKTYTVNLNKKADGLLYKDLSGEKMTIKEIAYLDVATGLPTKIERYEEVDGKLNLADTTVYEYKYIETAGDLFNTDGINLKELAPFNYDGNGVG